MKQIGILLVLCVVHALAVRLVHAKDSSAKVVPPNIVFILADDMGYGDVHALNPERCKIKTPNLDRLANQGMVFTDAHSGSSVCTPTRYGILTGRYAWRTRLQSSVLYGTSPSLIAPNRLTTAKLLKGHGYATACIGKWHLGLDWPLLEASETKERTEAGWAIDYKMPIANGPLGLGFDRFFGISASADMPPYAFLQNDKVTVVPTVEKTWIRKGAAAQDFEAIDILPALTLHATKAIAEWSEGAKQGKPFFLYLPLASPHTPIVPTKDWEGKSGLGPYGDFVMQTDAAVGDVMAALEKHGVAENTLIIFTSDNGCSPAADTASLERQGHFASADRRGYKADIWDGGHRVPFLASWPAKIKPGTRSEQVICLTDLMATCADLLGVKLAADAAEDSVSILPALLGTDKTPLHEAIIHHSIQGKYAIRQGVWKLAFCAGSGGWSKPGDKVARDQGLEELQLYNMQQDPREQQNLARQNPEVVARLTKLMEKIIAEGRSTPGIPQRNDAKIELWKKS